MLTPLLLLTYGRSFCELPKASSLSPCIILPWERRCMTYHVSVCCPPVCLHCHTHLPPIGYFPQSPAKMPLHSTATKTFAKASKSSSVSKTTGQISALYLPYARLNASAIFILVLETCFSFDFLLLVPSGILPIVLDKTQFGSLTSPLFPPTFS